MTQLSEPTVTAADTGRGFADVLLARVNELPGARLGDAALRTLLAGLVDAERGRAAARTPATDALHDACAILQGPERSALIALRRAIHNDRHVVELPAGAASLPAVVAWHGHAVRLHERTAQLAAGHAAFLAGERRALAEVIGAEPFRAALALNSPQVLAAVDRYRAGADTGPSARDRKSERGIVQHLARALVRVSPLSRFTAVGFARWDDAAPALGALGFGPVERTGRVRVDRPLLASAVTGVLHAPGSRTDAERLRRNPTLRLEADRISFQHWSPGRRRTVAAALTGEVKALLEATSMGDIDADVLVGTLADRLDVPAADCIVLVANACRAQILLPVPSYDETLDDPLPTASALLADHPEAAGIVAALAADLGEVERGTVEQRTRALARIHDHESALNAVTSCPARIQVNEDSVLPARTVSSRGYETALDDLRAVTAFHGVFDRHHVVRALLVRAFVERYGHGASVRLLGCADTLVADVQEREARLRRDTADALGPADGSLRALLELRRGAEAAMHATIGDARGEVEIALDAALLRDTVAGLPDRFATPGSYGLLVQPVEGRLVLNGCYNGHGLVGTRFLHADADATDGIDAAGRVRDRIVALGGGVRVAEDAGLHLANINHHRRILDDQLTGDDWVGLRLTHDPATDTVGVHDSDGRPLRVFSLGMRWLELQPNPLRLAVWTHDTGRVALDPVTRMRAKSTEDSDATVAYPRLLAGDVVLSRRRWYPGRDFAPDPADDAASLAGLTRWRARHDVPEQLVAKTEFASPVAESAPADIASVISNRRREKPQYLDLASTLTARVLPKLMERRSDGFLEEALPGVRPGVHAAEWAMELDLPGGARC